MPPIVELTSESLPAFIAQHKRCVVHFWASWNAHDREMRGLLDELASGFEPAVAFGSFDTEPPAHHDLCRSMGILNLPFLAFFRDGERVASLTGLRSRDALRERLGTFCTDLD